MAVLLFKLRHVPEDEAEEVRALLAGNGIEFYETSAGNWNISMPGIWLNDDSQRELALELLEEYQLQRLNNARREYEQLKVEGQIPTIAHRFHENPVRFIFYSGLILGVLYLSLHLFLGL
ncbi:MAG: DUF6164 family protein [Pseudohongiellaceae bacterium]